MNKTTLLLFFLSCSLYAQNSDWSWAKSFEDITNDVFPYINSFTDNQKNTYHYGVFRSPTITVEGTVITNSSEIPADPNIKYEDTYITKYDSEGNLLFVKHFTGSKFESITSITYDNNSNFYVTGSYSGSITLGSTTYQNQDDIKKFFLAKLDLNGNVIWSKPLNNSGNILLKFKDNYLYMAGIHTGDTYTMDNLTTPSLGYTAIVSNMDKIFVAKLDLSGNAIWLKSSTYNGSASIDIQHRIGTQPRGIAIDNLGNVYVAGIFLCSSTSFGSITISKSGATGNRNLFIVKYDSTGNVAWANTAITNLARADSSVADVATDSNNNVYLLGGINSSNATFGGITLTFAGSGSFIAKYATTGNVLWVKPAKVATDAQPITALGISYFFSLFIDGNNNAHATGSFIKYINFGNNLTFENSDPSKNTLFSVKYDSNGNVGDFYKITDTDNFDFRTIKIIDISADENVFYYTGKTQSSIFTLGNLTINNPENKALSYIAKRDKRLSVEEHTATNFTVYPNPSQEQMYVTSAGLSAENVLFTVYDLNGKKIKSVESKNNDTATIDVKDLAAGTYVLKIENGEANKSVKFVKS